MYEEVITEKVTSIKEKYICTSFKTIYYCVLLIASSYLPYCSGFPLICFMSCNFTKNCKMQLDRSKMEIRNIYLLNKWLKSTRLI